MNFSSAPSFSYRTPRHCFEPTNFTFIDTYAVLFCFSKSHVIIYNSVVRSGENTGFVVGYCNILLHSQNEAGRPHRPFRSGRRRSVTWLEDQARRATWSLARGERANRGARARGREGGGVLIAESKFPNPPWWRVRSPELASVSREWGGRRAGGRTSVETRQVVNNLANCLFFP